MEEKMSRISLKVVSVFGTLVVGLVLSQFANGQTPVGEPRPVVVVNSASSPVPVTGTVTGTVEISNTATVNATQSGPWNVSLLGTPTVKIDPDNNTVKIAGNGTALVFLDTRSYPDSNGKIDIGSIDIRQYSKVRVQVVNSGGSDVDMTVSTADLSALPSVYLFENETVTVGANSRFNKVYDTLGTWVLFSVRSHGGSGSVQLAVFGSH
jgi:hypothetical protein